MTPVTIAKAPISIGSIPIASETGAARTSPRVGDRIRQVEDRERERNGDHPVAEERGRLPAEEQAEVALL